MKYHFFLSLLLPAACLLTSCRPKPVRGTEMNIVFFGPANSDSTNNHYPKDIQDIVEPIQDACTPKQDLTFYPLNILRADIGEANKIVLDYENNKATDYTKIKAVERSLNKFFEKETAPAWLNTAINKNFDFNTFLSQDKQKNETFIFSENPQPIAGIKSFDNINDLRNAVANLVCEKKVSKIIILYKPANTDAQVQIKDSVSNSAPAASSPAAPVPITLPVKATTTARVATRHPVYSGNLAQNMQNLVNGTLNAEEKEVLKESILKKFDPDAKVYTYNRNTATGVKNIHAYLESLIVTPDNITRIVAIDSAKKFEDGKIYDLYVHETTNEKGN